MKDTTAAGRYARGLFMTTEKRGETVRALEDLKSMVDTIKPGTPLGGFLAAPQVRWADKREMLQRGLEGKALAVVVHFVDLLVRKKRLGDFATAVDEFEALVEASLGIKRAHVVSAVPLEPEETGRLQEALERVTRSRIKLTAAVDPGLLGGAFVRIGDRVIDRSVRTMIEAVEEQLRQARA